MSTYNIVREGSVLRLSFGTPAQNNQIVKDVVARLEEMEVAGELSGGDVIKFNGPASLPVAMVLCHKVAHLFGAVACFDPKLAKYVVSVSHTPEYAVGDLID